MPFRRFFLFLALVLASCAKPAPAPRAPDPLQIGSAKPGPLLAVPPPDAVDTSDADARIPIAKDDAIRGSRNAYVTLVVFSDFQCPFCSRLAPTFDRIREEYGSDNIRIVFKHEPLPFHEHAKLAATVAQGVLTTRGPEAFWRFHDMAFRRQQLISEESIRQWALASGMDEAELDAGLRRGTWAEKVERDIALANRVGANGTPTSFINGVELGGAQPFERFKETIDAELAKAKAMEARGVARAKIYREAVAQNFQDKPREEADEPQAEDRTVFKIPVAGSPTRGPATALVTIVEFGDFQCPFCKRVEATLEKIRADYGTRVRIVWKDEPLPFHPRAQPSATLAREARAQKGEAGFWDVHDRLFSASPNLEDSDLEGVARAAGLDVKKAMAAVTKDAHKLAISADADVADDFSANGTPHFFINGRRLVGAQPYEKFKALIDEELPKAEALARSGVALTAIYETTIKDGNGPAELEQKSARPNPSAPFRGPANAPVVIQEFSDFQCPFCGRAEPTLDQILKTYPTKVKIVWRDMPLPFHVDAPLAAEAAREAYAQKGNAGFQKMRELLFKNQHQLKRQDLEGYAAKIGLDLTKFRKALDDHRHKAAIDADADAGRDAGINGTPGFLVGPYFISGAQPYAKFRRAIERALAGPPAPIAAGSAGATGLGIVDLTPGSGPAVKNGDTVTVHYTGTLTNGTVFDSSRKSGQPFTFQVGAGHVIKGWEKGLVGMKVGGKRKLTIPADLGYGDRGAPPVIPPKSTLVFEIELLSIK